MKTIIDLSSKILIAVLLLSNIKTACGEKAIGSEGEITDSKRRATAEQVRKIVNETGISSKRQNNLRQHKISLFIAEDAIIKKLQGTEISQEIVETSDVLTLSDDESQRKVLLKALKNRNRAAIELLEY